MTGTADPQRTITVIGRASATTVADQAVLAVGIEVHAVSAAAALAELAAHSQAVLTAAHTDDLHSATVRTAGLSLHPHLDPATGQLSGYRAVQSVTVTVSDLATTAQVVDALSRTGGDTLRIANLAMSVADDTATRWQATDAAFRDAAQRATRLADAAGVTLGAVLQITETLGGLPPSPRPAAFAARPAAASAAVPIEPGLTTITAELAVTYAITQP